MSWPAKRPDCYGMSLGPGTRRASSHTWPTAARPATPTRPTMRTFFTSTTLCLALMAGAWYCLTSTLNDMTRADCQAGVQRACDSLR